MQSLHAKPAIFRRCTRLAIQSYDWTVITTEGQAVESCRGVEGAPNKVTSLVTGYKPVLLNRTNIDGKSLLAPYNLITSFYWVYDESNVISAPFFD